MNTTLLDACIVGDLARVKYILSDNRSNINSRGENNVTPVLHAAMNGHREVFDLLVREGANLSLLDDTGLNILHSASIGGNVEIVKYVLTQNIMGINSRQKYGFTPAMNAALYKRKEAFDLLVKAGADLLLMNDLEQTILHVACQGGNIVIIKYLIKREIVDIDSRDVDGWTAVMHAASDGRKDVFDVLVKAGANLSLVNSNNESILHLACVEENVEIVKYLMKRDIVDINSQDINGWTPIMHAVSGGHKDVFDVFLEAGADLSHVSHKKENILHLACDGGNTEIVKYLVKQDIVDLNSQDVNGWTPLMFAAYAGDAEVFGVLVEAGGDMSQVCNDKENILHMACRGGNVKIVKYLLTHDIVDIDSQDEAGWTPVMHTAEEKRKDAFDLLVKWGADLSLVDGNSDNILHFGCDAGSVEIVKYLLTHNVMDINSRNGDDCTPAMIAARKGHEAVFFLLVDHQADLSAVNDAGDNILNMACEGENAQIVKYVSTRHIVEAYREDDPC
ncbi:putative ankyrin repeat protein RF_0381 [Haliotis asinina]|uniref:putative ankyrin repeat protein RF_0381 n=1 Tax=Haliotis asinina TaxID=109174 RepID=UPI003531E4CD